MIEKSTHFFTELFLKLGLSEDASYWLNLIILGLIVVILCMIADRLARITMVRIITTLARKSKTEWDDILVEKKFFAAVAHLAPVLLIEVLVPIFFKGFPTFVDYVIRANDVYLIAVVLIMVNRFLNATQKILSRMDLLKDKPLESYFQLAKIVIGIIAGVLILSVLVSKSPIYFFSAFGAMTAVILFVFKDTILGFIASIQLSANDMIRVGDWVQMDKYGADGDVLEINLTTVKVKNWDKTISTVPTYSFISDSFKNWRGMQETGARRIARSVFINISSVKFATPEMIERFKNIHIINKYVEDKQAEIAAYNKEHEIDTTHVSNGRRMTNLGTFRAYAKRYLERHPKVDKSLTIMVRQLEPNEKGVPVQIYCFCNDIAWENYEAVQSDIMDHLLSVVPQFDLQVFQNPSGSDFRKLQGE
tara:strand:+ start:270 stop:1529 length:1260 start_codon:yes stop_codon:yes gene_type:complete